MAVKKDNMWNSILERLSKETWYINRTAEFEQFVEDARIIVLQKVSEQQKKQMLGVTAEIETTLKAFSPWENYFALKDHLGWSAWALIPDTWDEVAEKFNELKEHLDRLDAQLKSQPTSRDERLIWASRSRQGGR